MNLKYVSFTDSGKKRNENEDSLYTFKKDKCAVFLVADGMGGYENGQNASDTIVRHVAKYIEVDIDKVKDANKQFDKPYDSNAYFTDIKKYLLAANADIFNNYTAKGHSSGSTLVMIAIYDNAFNIYTAGDSHIYQVIDNELVALTVDDVWENDEKRTEGLTAEEIKKNENYGRLTNAFGTIENVNIHIISGILKEGMRFILCSDGVYKYCDKKFLDETFSAKEIDTEKIGETIKEEIYKNDAPDNLSFIYLEVEGNGD